MEDEPEMFYNSKSEIIPYNIKSDFIKSNFLLIFVNPISGSQEGKIILDYVKDFRQSSITTYNIIHFPIEEDIMNDWLPFSGSRSVQSFDEIRINPKKDLKKGLNEEKTDILHPTKFDPSIPFSVIIFNLIDKIDYINGKYFIKKYLSDFPNNKLKILIGGGDGSVLSTIEDLFKEKINLEKCVFGAMPLGTGNDLSNAMGFDATCEIGIKIEYFQRVLYTYLSASVINIDIWNLELKVDKNEGKIYDIIANGEIELKDEKNSNKNLTFFSKTFINYMSIGFDAKVGFIFGQKRTRSRLCNKAIYAWEAGKNIFKGLFQKNLGLSSLLESLISLENENIENNNEDMEYSKDDNYFFDDDGFKLLNNKKIIFESIDKRKKKNYNPTILKGNPVVIVCQNINYYMGGTEHIWGNTNKIGIQPCGLKRREKKLFEQELLKSFKNQLSDDRKIEFITYNHGMDMGLERVSKGNAKKIHQGKGPFIFTFKKILSKAQKRKLNKVYINIDGEFYHLVQPKQIVISINDKMCKGQIKFLKNEFAIWRLKQKTLIQKIKKNLKYYKYSLIIFPYIFFLVKFGFDTSFIYLMFMFLLFF